MMVAATFICSAPVWAPSAAVTKLMSICNTPTRADYRAAVKECCKLKRQQRIQIVIRGLDPRIHQSSQKHFSKWMDCRVEARQ
jgi:hypothetical protein